MPVQFRCKFHSSARLCFSEATPPRVRRSCAVRSPAGRPSKKIHYNPKVIVCAASASSILVKAPLLLVELYCTCVEIFRHKLYKSCVA